MTIGTPAAASSSDTVPEAASAASAVPKAARLALPSSLRASPTTGWLGDPATAARPRSAGCATAGTTTRRPGWAAATRASVSPKRGARRATSASREPGSASTTGASGAMPWRARKAAASAGVA